MSYSMMFKKSIVFSLFLLLFWVQSSDAYGSERKALPDGEVLVVYSDGITQERMENVHRIIEILTCEGTQTAFASASRCAGNLSGYQEIIFYELEAYPSELIAEINDIEKQAAGPKLLFVGNAFFREYLDATWRSGKYTACTEKAGTLRYDDGNRNSRQSLAALEELIFLKGEYDYQAGSVRAGAEAGYFFASQGRLSHITVSDLEKELVRDALVRELFLWREGYEETYSPGQYLVIDRVYPFQNPENLLAFIKKLSDEKMPFAVSVMPVYTHGDYPAMQRFCEVLRYAQDRGGVVVLHAPLNQMVNFDVDQMNEAIVAALDNYMQHGVYPMGLEVPENWMGNSGAVEVMSRFSTILVSQERDERLHADWQEAETNPVFRYGHQWIATAEYLDINDEPEQLELRIEECRKSSVPIRDLWELSHSFYTNKDTMSYRDHTIYLNGDRVDKTFEPTQYEEEFSYNRNRLQRFSRDLTNENHRLLVVVLFVSALFILFLIIARYHNRSRFFYEEEDKEEYWENKG